MTKTIILERYSSVASLLQSTGAGKSTAIDATTSADDSADNEPGSDACLDPCDIPAH